MDLFLNGLIGGDRGRGRPRPPRVGVGQGKVGQGLGPPQAVRGGGRDGPGMFAAPVALRREAGSSGRFERCIPIGE